MIRKPNFTHLGTAIAFLGILSVLGIAGCASPERTATNFCRQLALEMPGIAEQPATPAMITSTVKRYKRLQEVAPLQVEAEWNALTLLMEKASKIDAADAASVQEVVDLSYATEKSATAASAWVLATCGVDISTGLSVVQAPATDVATTDVATTDVATTLP
ncbi:MAG: hypothetical protein D4R95_02575 [Actinobacteria bacterium]|nr:MAG: hypothetical protein D4R95_02575 [Actinomycetota bacterium]